MKTLSYKELYLSWLNDFLTVARFAEYYFLSERQAKLVINKGRVLHQDKFGHH